jgi:glycosyltransferase involved in cell wall biosynthesis
MRERAKTTIAEPRALHERTPITKHSLSVILPAYNEVQVIANTVRAVHLVLDGWKVDFEIIVVNDGSTDQTGAILAMLAAKDPRIRFVTHPFNQGYGAALVSGFAAGTRELTFFMDADGQFDIRDLRTFFLFIDRYDAVIGYRMDRQDSWMRKLNAWGWKLLIGWMLDVHVRDVDCAFKLLHTEFLHQHPLETRGAMINAELLYTLTQAEGTYKELGIKHLPRQAGRATGAKLSVILRAFRELITYAHKRHQKEQEKKVQAQELHSP